MARFQINLRHFLAPRAAQASVVQHALRDLMAEARQGAAQGPGWFDSSFDLWHGLEVRDAGDGGYDDWLAARAIAERRAAAKRSAATAAAAAIAAAAAHHAAPSRHPNRTDETEPLDLAELADLTRLVRPLPAPNKPRTVVPQDDFSRFGIEGLALA